MSALDTADKIKAQEQLDKMDSPMDYLFIYYDLYVNTIYSLSLSQPTQYYELRNLSLKESNTELITKTYEIVFNILRYAQIGTVSYTNDEMPRYPADIKCSTRSVWI